MELRACMNTNPVTVQPDTELKEALELMTHYGLRHIPVVDAERRFLGVIRHHDVCTELSRPGANGGERGVLSLAEIGTLTLRCDDRVADAWALLGRSPGFNPLPVVEHGRLAGTVSPHELLRAMAGLPPQGQAAKEGERNVQGCHGLKVWPSSPHQLPLRVFGSQRPPTVGHGERADNPPAAGQAG